MYDIKCLFYWADKKEVNEFREDVIDKVRAGMFKISVQMSDTLNCVHAFLQMYTINR